MTLGDVGDVWRGCGVYPLHLVVLPHAHVLATVRPRTCALAIYLIGEERGSGRRRTSDDWPPFGWGG